MIFRGIISNFVIFAVSAALWYVFYNLGRLIAELEHIEQLEKNCGNNGKCKKIAP